MNIHLLDYIAQKCDVPYLSSIRNCPRLKEEIKKISNGEDFPIEEWNETVTYLTDSTQKFENVNDAKNYLIEYDKSCV